MELIVRTDRELRRIEHAIAAFEARSPAERRRMANLLLALKAERDELLRHGRGTQRQH